MRLWTTTILLIHARLQATILDSNPMFVNPKPLLGSLGNASSQASSRQHRLFRSPCEAIPYVGRIISAQ
jgi:hypothetical protein